MRAYTYPLLLAIAPVLALAAENTDQGTVPSDLPVPLLVSASVALIGLLIGRAVSRSRDAQALVALTTVILFSAYGPAKDLFPSWLAEESHIQMLGILGILFVAGVVAVRWIRRTRLDLTGVTRIFFTFGILLVLWFGARFAAGTRWTAESSIAMAEEGGPPRRAAPDAPDIWLVVLDAYTGQDALRSQFGFDNSAFLDSLRVLGFQVAEGGRANYVLTVLSLGAMLNLDYLHDDLGRIQDPRTPDERLEDNRVVRELKDMGYEFIFSRSAFPPLSSNRYADIQLPDRLAREFASYWAGRTVLYPITFLVCYLKRCQDGALFMFEPVAEIRKRADALVKLADRPGPKFVFAHFMIPHVPFRADSTCALMDPTWPDLSPESRDETRTLYTDQLKCTNRVTLSLVDGILANSRRPSVILLQGDHGFGMFEGDHPVALEEARPEQVEDRIQVFGAYRFPGESVILWPGITPVNIFRVLFNIYFDRELDPLRDRTYWSSWEDPYGFVLISTEGDSGTER
jgi:hypothetical protein